MGLDSAPLQATIGTALPVTIWLNDDSKREADTIPLKARGPARPAVNVVWYKHSGTGAVKFDPARNGLTELAGTAATTATFTQPGTYTLRVRVDHFGRPDTSPTSSPPKQKDTAGHPKVPGRFLFGLVRLPGLA